MSRYRIPDKPLRSEPCDRTRTTIERFLLAASSSERSLKSTRSSSRALSNLSRTTLLRVVSSQCDAAVGHVAITMLRRSLPASGTSRNQNTAADRDATISRLPAWSVGRDVSVYWPPSHAVKRRGDVNTSVFVLVTTRIPCGRVAW